MRPGTALRQGRNQSAVMTTALLTLIYLELPARDWQQRAFRLVALLVLAIFNELMK